MLRRNFCLKMLTFGSVAVVSPQLLAAQNSKKKVFAISRSEEEWRSILSKEQYRVLREEGTERPFSSPLNNEKRKGDYVCAGCDNRLFTSEMKYDSGTGWPSFYRAIEKNIGKKKDFRILFPRTEYHCARCGGHQGHVFKDGPKPTNDRWCNNGVALKFIPASSG
ncbi:MAG: peptide-methionine (R)-S-oxide reductase MsrB [Magnetococcales bacterium]|nr:peptide-methionine (R)-S-oxide reductase MsrB [Magnetococcales bacterium]